MAFSETFTSKETSNDPEIIDSYTYSLNSDKEIRVQCKYMCHVLSAHIVNFTSLALKRNCPKQAIILFLGPNNAYLKPEVMYIA